MTSRKYSLTNLEVCLQAVSIRRFKTPSRRREGLIKNKPYRILASSSKAVPQVELSHLTTTRQPSMTSCFQCRRPRQILRSITLKTRFKFIMWAPTKRALQTNLQQTMTIRMPATVICFNNLPMEQTRKVVPKETITMKCRQHI